MRGVHSGRLWGSEEGSLGAHSAPSGLKGIELDGAQIMDRLIPWEKPRVRERVWGGKGCSPRG